MSNPFIKRLVLRRRALSHRNDMLGLAVYVDLSNRNWYAELKRDLGCTEITTLDAREINTLDAHSMRVLHDVFAEGWGPNAAASTRVPIKYKRNYMDAMDQWLQRVENEIVRVVVSSIADMTPSMFRDTFLSHCSHTRRRSEMHDRLASEITRMVKDDGVAGCVHESELARSPTSSMWLSTACCA